MYPDDLIIQMERSARIAKKSLQLDFNREAVPITVEQFFVLDMVDILGKPSATLLATETYKDAPSITRFMSKLVELKLVNRHSDTIDRRKFSFTITTKGHSLLQKCRPIAENNRKQGFMNISEQERLSMLNSVQKIMDNYPLDAF